MTPGLQSEPTLQVVAAQPPPMVDQVAQAPAEAVSPLDPLNDVTNGDVRTAVVATSAPSPTR